MADAFDYRRFYDRVAPVYAWGQVVLPVWRHNTEAALPWVPKGGIVLEVGPGPGLLLVRDPIVSFRHCVVSQTPEGHCFVRDVSRNGTRLDGRRLVP